MKGNAGKYFETYISKAKNAIICITKLTRKRELKMEITFEQLKKTMLNGLEGEFKRSIEGIIDCSEKIGKIVPETMDKIAKILLGQ